MMCFVARNSARKRRKVAVDGRGKMVGQLAAGGGLHLGEHVGGPAAGEIVRNNIRRQREASAHELLRYDGGSQLFAVDQDPIAVENDHRALRCLAG